MRKTEGIVTEIVEKYWVGYPSYVIANYIQRHAFEVGLLVEALGRFEGKVVVDVGGGWGAFAAVCSALGMKATLIDDFGDGGMNNSGDPRQALAKNYGVNFVNRDVIMQGVGLLPDSVDAVSSFDMIEHVHASPRQFLRDSVTALRPNGVLLLGAPNCVNIRKRITVPLGKGQWSDFSDWYDRKVFRGHVREPDVRDLKKIAEDLRLIEYRILGRNWLGFGSPRWVIRLLAGVCDRMLQLWPSACSNLYLLGRK